MSAADLFAADPNFTLGMDPDRYLTHQRGECPTDQPCALCLLDAETARADAFAAGKDEEAGAADANHDAWEQAIRERDEARAALDRVRALCDEAESAFPLTATAIGGFHRGTVGITTDDIRRALDGGVVTRVPLRLVLVVEEVCEVCFGTGVVKCWDPGGPCPVRNEPGCETCGPCQTCGGAS